MPNHDKRNNRINEKRFREIDRRVVSSVGRAPVCYAGGRGFEPQTGPTVRVLK